MSVPLVSVLLPVYNGEPYLAAALESVLRQDYERLEVIAIDDGSTDRSLHILRRYQEADGRLRVVSRENRGLVATLNEGMTMAKGELIARMDADDIAYPTRFSRQIALFQEQPRLGISGTGVDRLIGDRVVRGTPNPIHRSADWHVLSMFYTVFMHSTVMYNRNVIPADMLTYDATYVHAEDFDLFRRITREFPAAMIDESLVAYRVHDESVTNKHRRPMRRTQRTRLSRCASARTTSQVPSGELSSTNTTSQATLASVASSRRYSTVTLSRSLNVGTMTDSSGAS